MRGRHFDAAAPSAVVVDRIEEGKRESVGQQMVGR